MSAEQDIQKFEASSVAQRPGPGATQHANWKVLKGTNLTTVRIGNHHLLLTNLLNSKVNHGDSLAEIVPEEGDVVGVLTPVFQKGSPLNRINDNYLSGPTVSLVHQFQLDPPYQDKSVSVNPSLNNFQTVVKVPLFKTKNLLDVYCPVVSPVHSVLSHGHPQKKGVSPGNCLNKIKSVKSVSCVNPCVFAPVAHSVPSAVAVQNVGGRLQDFWQVWQAMGSNPQVVSILKRGYTLPFKQRPVLTRFPVVQSGYANPSKNMHLKEALVSLMGKLVVEKVGSSLPWLFTTACSWFPNQTANGDQS